MGRHWLLGWSFGLSAISAINNQSCMSLVQFFLSECTVGTLTLLGAATPKATHVRCMFWHFVSVWSFGIIWTASSIFHNLSHLICGELSALLHRILSGTIRMNLSTKKQQCNPLMKLESARTKKRNLNLHCQQESTNHVWHSTFNGIISSSLTLAFQGSYRQFSKLQCRLDAFQS
jgi:hypothetical protein